MFQNKRLNYIQNCNNALRKISIQPSGLTHQGMITHGVKHVLKIKLETMNMRTSTIYR